MRVSGFWFFSFLELSFKSASPSNPPARIRDRASTPQNPAFAVIHHPHTSSALIPTISFVLYPTIDSSPYISNIADITPGCVVSQRTLARPS